MGENRTDVDERTVAVDHVAGNSAYRVMGWLLVGDLAIRAKWPAATVWRGYPIDVLAVLLAGYLTWSWVAWRNRIVSRRHLRRLFTATVAAAVVAAAMIWFVR